MASFRQNRMRMQSTKSKAVRGLDAYFSPYEALWPLIDLEPNMPQRIWEPAAGNGVVVRALRQEGFKVIASDIADYHTRYLGIQTGINYLEAVMPEGVKGIVTNPPYGLARDFIEKADKEVGYHAWLLRTNFLESERRFHMFKSNPPARILISSARLPMMHRLGYDGPKNNSNTCFSWFIWDDTVPMKDRGKTDWFYWPDHYRELISDY